MVSTMLSAAIEAVQFSASLAGARLGWIWEKCPDFGFAGAGAGAEIRCNPNCI